MSKISALFNKRTWEHPKEELTATAAQHTKDSSPAMMNQQTLTVAETDATNKSDEKSTVAARGRDGTPFPTDAATVDVPKWAGAIPEAQEKQSETDAKIGGPAMEVTPPNDATTHRSGNSGRFEDSARLTNPLNSIAIHSRRDVSQDRQAQVEGSASTNGSDGIPTTVSHLPTDIARQPVIPEPNAVSSSPGSPMTLPPRNSSLKAPSTTGPLVPRDPGGISTKFPVISPTHSSTRSRVQFPPVAPVPGEQGDDCVQPSIDAVPQQGSSSPAQGNTVEINERGKDLARRCWEEGEGFLAKDKVAEWLSEQEPINKAALWHYFQYFDFTGLHLDEAFRQLCKKLYLKAEPHQVDRILDVFGKRYWECNPDSVFGSASVAHIVTYSLFMLNADLHNTESTKRMSRGGFVRNTMDAIQTHPPPPSHPGSVSEDSGHSPGIAIDENRGRKMRRALKNIYNATKSQQIVLDSTHISAPPSPPSGEGLYEAGIPVPASAPGFVSRLTDMANGAGEGDEQDVNSDLELFGSPWAKEGMLWHSHGLQLLEKSMRMTKWVNVFVVVQKGELSWFKFGGHGMGSGTMGDGNWLNNAQPVRSVKLAHSVAQALPEPGYDDQRPRCVALTLANGDCEYFQAGTEELVDEWVSTCNYWAARKSKEPLSGGGSNMEYGWTRNLPSNHSIPEDEKEMPSADSDRRVRAKPSYATLLTRARVGRSPQNDHVVIHDWKPPTPPSEESKRRENDQLEALEKYVSSLETDFQKHNGLRARVMDLRKSHPNDAAKADTNWGKRSQHLQEEIVKYRIYIDSLNSTIEARGRRALEGTTSTGSLASEETQEGATKQREQGV